MGEADAALFATQHPLTILGPSMQDFADAAAILSQLDLLISVDTAMAHLAGALGNPCWLLLPDYMTDWRWGRGSRTSAWYPDVLQLYRQTRARQWETVISELIGALHQFAG